MKNKFLTFANRPTVYFCLMLVSANIAFAQDSHQLAAAEAVQPLAVAKSCFPNCLPPAWIVSKNKSLIDDVSQPNNTKVLLGYQGFPLVAINPKNPKWQIASGLSETTSPYTTPGFWCMSGFPLDLSKVTGTAALFGSTDGGLSWEHSCAPWAGPANGPPGANSWAQRDPAVAWDDNNVAYAVYAEQAHASVFDPEGVDVGASGESLVIARSTNGGKFWSDATVIKDPNGPGTTLPAKYSYYRQNRIAIDTSSNGAHSVHGRKYVVSAINQINNNRTIQVSRSDDFVNWHTFVLPLNPLVTAAAPNIVVGADGTVYVLFTGEGQFGPGPFPDCFVNDATVLIRSIDGGVSWSPMTVFDQHLYHTSILPIDGIMPPTDFCLSNWDPPAQKNRRANTHSVMDIDRNPKSPYFGTLYLVNTDYAKIPVNEYAKADLDVFLRHSNDGGATWSERLRVNDDVIQKYPATQFLPTLSVDQSDGSVNIAWLDTRNEVGPFKLDIDFGVPEMISLYTQVYFARSHNGGLSITKNRLITDAGTLFHDAPTDGNYLNEFRNDIGSWGEKYQYGDWLGIAAANRNVRLMWTDNRSLLWTQQDIATADVTVCAAPIWVPQGLQGSYNAGTVNLSWNPVTSWGAVANAGTYRVERLDGHSTVWKLLASGLTVLGYADVHPPSGQHAYRVTATNNCVGTTLTPMSVTSASVAITTP